VQLYTGLKELVAAVVVQDDAVSALMCCRDVVTFE